MGIEMTIVVAGLVLGGFAGGVVIGALVSRGELKLIRKMLVDSQDKLMWFHDAGKLMGQYNLERARIDVDARKSEAEAKAAEAHRTQIIDSVAMDPVPVDQDGKPGRPTGHRVVELHPPMRR